LFSDVIFEWGRKVPVSFVGKKLQWPLLYIPVLYGLIEPLQQQCIICTIEHTIVFTEQRFSLVFALLTG
jgi:hypothetical protein